MLAEWNNHPHSPQHHEHASDSSSSEGQEGDYSIGEDVVRQPMDDFLRTNNRLLHRRGRNGELRSMSPPQPNGHHRLAPKVPAKQPMANSKRRLGSTIRLVAYFLICGYALMIAGGYFLLKRHDEGARHVVDRASFLEPRGPLYALREKLEERRLSERTTWVSQEAQRASKRKDRTKPPVPKVEEELPAYPYNIISMDADSKRITSGQPQARVSSLCGEHARKAAADNPGSFQARDALNSKSRVLITGILNPIGFHLALALKERCGVEVIGGIDPLFPNTVEQRLALQKRIQILTTHIPKLVQPIGSPLVGLDPKPSKQKKAAGDSLPITGEQSLLNMNPTHVIHLATYAAEEHQDFGDETLRNLQSPYVGENRKADMFAIRSSQVAMEQVLASMATSDKLAHFTYASGVAQTKLMDEVLADSYSALNDVFSVGLRMPDMVYGPWSRPRSQIHEISKSAIAELRGNGTVPAFSDTFRDFVYVDDIVEGVIAAMQFRSEGKRSTLFDFTSDTRFSVESARQFVSQLTKTKGTALDMTPPQISRRKLSDLAEQTRSLLTWTPKTALSVGLAKTMAWHLDDAFPYGDKIDKKGAVETGDQFRTRVGIETCSPDDLLCHVGRKFLPCLSECSTQSQCVPSIFEGVARLTVESTEGCDIVLYTQSLGYNAQDLKLTATYKDEGTPMVCNFAFVPESSRLVDAVIKKVPEGQLASFGVKKTSDADALHKRKIEGLNGRLLYKGWILIWVKDAHEPLPNHDMYALKMSPGRLFSSDVRHALFVDEGFPISPDHEDVLFLVGQTHRPPLPDRNAYRKMKDGKKLKYRLTAEPERRAAIVMSPLKYKKHAENGQPAKISVYEATKYMQVEIGENPEAKESPSVKKQREFYERIPTFINKLDFRSGNEAWYKYELKNWVRTRWIVHDLHLEEARQIRCEWYHEQVQWDNKLDQLSFAHVMASRELERRIAFQEPDDHVKSIYVDHPEYLRLSDAHEWHPVESEVNRVVHANQPLKALTLVADHMVDKDEKEQPEDGVIHSVKLPSAGNRDVPLFVRIVSEAVMMKARQVWADEHPAMKK